MNTFNTTFSIGSPRDDLISNIAFPINDDHRDPGIGQVGYTFVADDGDEFRAWVAGGKGSDVVEYSIAVGDAGWIDINMKYKFGAEIECCARSSKREVYSPILV
jgi:hypothetical protein